jgi:hypothetical protein
LSFLIEELYGIILLNVIMRCGPKYPMVHIYPTTLYINIKLVRLVVRLLIRDIKIHYVYYRSDSLLIFKGLELCRIYRVRVFSNVKQIECMLSFGHQKVDSMNREKCNRSLGLKMVCVRFK